MYGLLCAPCGNTSDYDMRRIYEAGDGICTVKLQILEKLQRLAAYVCRSHGSGTSLCIDNVFYKALSYVSYDMDEPALLGLLDEAKIWHLSYCGKTLQVQRFGQRSEYMETHVIVQIFGIRGHNNNNKCSLNFFSSFP